MTPAESPEGLPQEVKLSEDSRPANRSFITFMAFGKSPLGTSPYLPINPAGLFFAGLGGPVGEDDSLEDEKLQNQVENNQTNDDVPPVPLEPSSTRFFVL